MTSAELTSPRAPRVAAARRLTKRAFRQQDRRFLAEGPQAVREAVATAGRGGPSVVEIFATAESLDRHSDIAAAAAAKFVPVTRVSAAVMAALAQTVTPQGVVAVCAFIDVPLQALVAAEPRLVAVLAHVRDPGNAGTVIRTADAAGAQGVVLTEASVDVYNGKCIRASAGSVFHLPVVAASRVADAVAALRGAGLQILAADGHGDLDLDEFADSGALARPTAWVFGNEAWGLPPETRGLADAVVRVPIHGRAESLNLATAAAVCLYASARAHRRAGSRAS